MSGCRARAPNFQSSVPTCEVMSLDAFFLTPSVSAWSRCCLVQPPLETTPIRAPVEDHSLTMPDSESVRTCPLMWFAGLVVVTTATDFTPSNSYAVHSKVGSGCGATRGDDSQSESLVLSPSDAKERFAAWLGHHKVWGE